jgi:hypothetical protein
MRPPRVVDSCGVVLGLVHVQTIESPPRSCCPPYASFQQEDTYMPAGNISADIHHVVARCARA